MNNVIVGLVCSVLGAAVTAGTLIFKFSSVVSMVKRHDEDIKELKNSQKEYQEIVLNSLEDIKKLINNLDKTICLFGQRLDYVERGMK